MMSFLSDVREYTEDKNRLNGKTIEKIIDSDGNTVAHYNDKEEYTDLSNFKDMDEIYFLAPAKDPVTGYLYWRVLESRVNFIEEDKNKSIIIFDINRPATNEEIEFLNNETIFDSIINQ